MQNKPIPITTISFKLSTLLWKKFKISCLEEEISMQKKIVMIIEENLNSKELLENQHETKK